MSKLTDILRKVLYGSDALMGNSYVEGLEAAINQYISEIIGEDEEVTMSRPRYEVAPGTKYIEVPKAHGIEANQLRAEQRKAAGL